MSTLQSETPEMRNRRDECNSRSIHTFEEDEAAIVSNEYVLVSLSQVLARLLPYERMNVPDPHIVRVIYVCVHQNVAFLSFLGFTTLQLVFAMVAHSQSMMTDCAAMYVDVLSYLVNFLAERLKHGKTGKNIRELRLHRLYLELVPPLASVTTLIGVTVISLKKACEVLLNLENNDNDADGTSPDLDLMLLFSGLNLVLDFVNVSCFARVDQAVGIPGQHGEENIHVHIERGGDHHQHHNNNEATEHTHLVKKHDDKDEVESEQSDEEHQGMNLNMCSGKTKLFVHVTLIRPERERERERRETC